MISKIKPGGNPTKMSFWICLMGLEVTQFLQYPLRSLNSQNHIIPGTFASCGLPVADPCSAPPVLKRSLLIDVLY